MLLDFLATFYDSLDPVLLDNHMEAFKKHVQDSIFDFSITIEVLDKVMDNALVISDDKTYPEGRIRECRAASLAEGEAMKEMRRMPLKPPPD